MSSFTEEEAKELGVNKKLLDQWELNMRYLWDLYKTRFILKSEENEIIIREYRVGANIVNNSYIEMYIKTGRDGEEKTLLTYRYKSKKQLLSVFNAFFKI